VFEFVGAMVLGRVSTNVIATGIADAAVFARDPEILAYGMVCAMTISGIWQVLASYLEFNVSSTHSIIGSIIGFALVYGGSTAVKWSVEDPASFPPYKVCCVLEESPPLIFLGGWSACMWNFHKVFLTLRHSGINKMSECSVQSPPATKALERIALWQLSRLLAGCGAYHRRMVFLPHFHGHCFRCV
jgi:hypothetical protein